MLEFKRTSKFNKENLSSKLRKDWISTKPQRYRITWRSMVCGVQVPAGFRATFLAYVPGNFPDGRNEMWAFVDIGKRIFKTLKKATEVCEKHSKSWDKALQCPSMRALKSLFDGRKPAEIPVWMYNHLDRNILSVLMDNNAHKCREEEDEIEYFETDFIPEPEPEIKEEKKTRRKKLKVVEEGVGTPLSIELPKKRKQRADKGKPRGPRKIEEPQAYDDTTDALKTTTIAIKKRGRPKGSKNKVKK